MRVLPGLALKVQGVLSKEMREPKLGHKMTQTIGGCQMRSAKK
jgi:hypothetical protein